MPDISDIYKTQQNPQFNPLQMLDLAQRGSELGGSAAVGNALARATGPDGSVNYDQATADLGAAAGQNPLIGKTILPHMQALMALKTAGMEADIKAVERYQRRWGLIASYLLPLMGKEDLKSGDITDVASNLMSHPDARALGVTTPMIANALGTMPRDPKTGKPVEGRPLRNWLAQVYGQVGNAADVLHAFSPKFEYVDRGGELVPRDVNPVTNPNPTAVSKNLPPTAPIVNPKTGQPRMVGEQPTTTPPAGFNPPARTVPPVSRAPGSIGGPEAYTGMPTGFNQAAEAVGTQSGHAANELTMAADTSMTRKGMLGNLEEDLNNFTAGPGADWTRIGKAFVNRNVPLPAGWQFDPKSIASQEAFNKQAAMLAQQQFAAIGGTGTDAKFESAFTTSPNEALSHLGNQGIIRLLKGNEDAIQAKAKAWRQWLRAGHGPDTYADFSDQFNDHFDPRAFQFKYLGQGKSPEEAQKERSAYVGRMEPGERERFLNDLAYAHNQGWIRYDVPTAPPAKPVGKAPVKQPPPPPPLIAAPSRPNPTPNALQQ